VSHVSADYSVAFQPDNAADGLSLPFAQFLGYNSVRLEHFPNQNIPEPAVKRLSLYLRQLEPSNARTAAPSPAANWRSLNLTDAQVRKDLAYFGQFGHPGIGYRVTDLIAQVKRILGTDKTWNVLLVASET